MLVVGRLETTSIGRELITVGRRSVVGQRLVGQRLVGRGLVERRLVRRRLVGRRWRYWFPAGANFSPSRRDTVGVNSYPARKVGVRYSGAFKVSCTFMNIVMIVSCIVVVSLRLSLYPLSRMDGLIEVR